VVIVPLTEIIGEIEEQTRQRLKAASAESQKESTGILQAAKAEAESIKASSDKELQEESNRLKMEHSASTGLLQREVELTAREEALDREMSELRKDLIKEIKSDPSLYKKIFTNAIRYASEIAPVRDFTIIVNKKDAELVKKTDAQIEYNDISGGLIIMIKSKGVRIDATLENIVESKAEEIKSMLLGYMFGDVKIKEKMPIAKAKAAKKITRSRAKSKKGKK
jgi:vacuolar-type H+-ATPase subunit E/Vma4